MTPTVSFSGPITPADMAQMLKVYNSLGITYKEENSPAVICGRNPDDILEREFFEESEWLKDNNIDAEVICFDTSVLVKFNNEFDAMAFKLRF